jgi:hypothetical protein
MFVLAGDSERKHVLGAVAVMDEVATARPMVLLLFIFLEFKMRLVLAWGT